MKADGASLVVSVPDSDLILEVLQIPTLEIP